MVALLLCTGCGNSTKNEDTKDDTNRTEISSQDVVETESEEVVRDTGYVQAYIDTIKECEQNGTPGTITYDLIYFDNDDIPELVAGVDSYYVSLYTYSDGNVNLVMDQWAYGAMGNHGYSYLPRQNVLYNSNADFAGALYYEVYMGMKDHKEMVTHYVVETHFFIDKNNNGYPDDNEYIDDPICYYNGKQITDEERKDIGFAGDYEDIIGRKSADEVINMLQEQANKN